MPTSPRSVRLLTLQPCKILTTAMFILVALLAYDSILTSEDEFELIWRRKLSIASAVFLTNRIAASLLVMHSTLADANNVRRAFREDHHHLTAVPGVSSLRFLASRGSTSGSQLSPNHGIVCGRGAYAFHRSGL